MPATSRTSSAREPSAAARRALADALRLPALVDELAQRFAGRGQPLYLVGGSVRDALLGRLGPDLDFTTPARPDEIREVLSGWADDVWDVGAAFGTIGALRDGHRLEVTTFRSDTYRPASRKPAVDFGDSLEGDLVRRDFTVNAMAVRLPDRHWVDPFDGARDLSRRLLRTPGAPETSFDDDPLRMLRAARFVAQLGFDVAPEVVEAMRAMAGRLAIVSAERVRDELSKLLLGPYPRRGLTLLVDTGLAGQFLPELPRLREARDAEHRHKDVYEHSLTVLDQAIELAAARGGGPDLVLRLAALLHDIGKPDTREFQRDGTVTFHHHEVRGAVLARARLNALRFPKDVVEQVTRLVELHLRFHGYARGEWTDSAVRRYVRDAGDVLDRLHVLVRSDCTTRNRRKAAALAAAYDSLEERIAELEQAEDLARLRPDLDGNEIMRLLGLPPGPLVGRAYRHLLDVRMERGPLPHDEAVAELRRWAEGEGLSLPGA